MEGLAASVVLIAILLGVLLVVGGLVYLLAQRLPKRSPEPPHVRSGVGGTRRGLRSTPYAPTGPGLDQIVALINE
jgi:hypothetical protein